MKSEIADKSIVQLNNNVKNLENNGQIISVNDEESKSSVLDINGYLGKDQKAYEVLKYNDNCEEHNQISYILHTMIIVKSIIKYHIFFP